MSLDLPLPDWVPWWGQLVILIGAILFGFALLMMPFSVFGLKGRLDFLEAQLDDIQADLRMIAARLPDPDRPPAREPVFEELVRPSSGRGPSPVQTPAYPPPRGLDQRVPPGSPPPSPSRPVAPPSDPFRADPRAVPPPRFPGTGDLRRDPAAAVPPRYQSGAQQREPDREGLGSGDWDDEQAPMVPRRPLRAISTRTAGHGTEADPGRDADRPAGRDRFRSEPTLRWPPR